MIPYFIRLKEQYTLKYCILCKQLCKKRQTVLVHMTHTVNNRDYFRYSHLWCVIKYSLKQRLKRRLKENGSKTKERVYNTN